MKDKFAYFSLVLAVLLLVGVAILLTNILLNLPPPETLEPSITTAAKKDSPPPKKPSTVAQLLADLDTPVSPQKTPPEKEARTVLHKETAAPGTHIKKKPGIGEALIVKGTVFAINQAMKRRTISPNSRVFLYDTIETGPASRLKLILDDGSSIAQGENSQFVIESYAYDPTKPKQAGFAMRFVKGACRVVSGLITKVNPKQFKVRTRMATIGIRGCDLGFRTQQDQDDIYIIDLSKNEHVRIDTTKDGSVLVNMDTGEAIPPADKKKTFIEVHESRSRVSIVRKKGPQEGIITAEELRTFVSETSHLAPSRYRLFQKSDGSVLTIQPDSAPSTPSSDPLP